VVPDTGVAREPHAEPQPSSAFHQPVARWPFRLLGLFFLLCVALVFQAMARDVLAGDFSGPWEAFGGLGAALASFVLTVVFAWVVVTGRVPDRLWRFMWTAIGTGSPQPRTQNRPDLGAGLRAGQEDAFDDGRIPHARWPFRIAAGAFVAAALLGTYGRVATWWQEGPSVGWADFADVGLLVVMGLMVWMFGAVALVGRVPALAWRCFTRVTRW